MKIYILNNITNCNSSSWKCFWISSNMSEKTEQNIKISMLYTKSLGHEINVGINELFFRPIYKNTIV